MLQARRYTGGSTQVANGADFVVEENPLGQELVAEIAFDQCDAGIVQPGGGVFAFEAGIVVVIEVVENDDVFRGRLQEMLDQVTTDEAGAASEEDGHVENERGAVGWNKGKGTEGCRVMI